MPDQFPVDLSSDSDGEDGPGGCIDRGAPKHAIDLVTPPPFPQTKKKQRINAITSTNDSFFIVIDDELAQCKENPTPVGTKSSSIPSFVAETPLWDPSLVKCSRSSLPEGIATSGQQIVPDTPMESEVSVPKCNQSVQMGRPLASANNSGETTGLIFVESDNEIEKDDGHEDWRSGTHSKRSDSSSFPSTSSQLQMRLQGDEANNFKILNFESSANDLEDVRISMVDVESAYNANELEFSSQISGEKYRSGDSLLNTEKADNKKKPARVSREEKLRLMNEKKEAKNREKLLKAASKEKAAELKKTEKEMQKWERGKYALKSIVAEIDKKVVELGSIGGHLLTRFSEKGISYRITSNPIERTIVWSMVIPEELSMVSSKSVDISYILVIYEAEDFCNVVANESLEDHVRIVQNQYPHYTICYATSRLKNYLNKREQAHYKNPADHLRWKRPPVDEIIAKLATHYARVHSRHCVDDAELAEHVVGLTCSLATCHFRKKLTRLSVNANGAVIPKDFVDKDLIKNNVWLKALVAIPKVQPRFAVAIWKKYPTMKSLLSVYMDPTRTVHEKEFLLKNLTTESLLGDDRRVGEVCSKRIYRTLMAQCGSIKTDDVENGADFFIREQPG